MSSLFSLLSSLDFDSMLHYFIVKRDFNLPSFFADHLDERCRHLLRQTHLFSAERNLRSTNIDQHWTVIRRREGILLFTQKELGFEKFFGESIADVDGREVHMNEWDIHLKLKQKDHTHSLALSLFSIQRTPYRCHWCVENNWPARNLEHLALSCLKSECDWSMKRKKSKRLTVRSFVVLNLSLNPKCLDCFHVFNMNFRYFHQ